MNSTFNGWGHLEYHDHGTGLNVHGTAVDYYGPGTLGPNSREITGQTNFNGASGFTYIVDVADNGEPGTMVDMFQIRVFDVMSTLVYSAGPALLGGGNIQSHNTCLQ